MFGYAGSVVYNTQANKNEGKVIAYRGTGQESDNIISIGAGTKHPELCMKIINYFATPQGYMTMQYGPQKLTWDYDKEGNPYLTKLGKKCMQDFTTKLGKGYKGTFMDGQLGVPFSIWASYATNPETKDGQPYDSKRWKSNKKHGDSNVEEQWSRATGCSTVDEYFTKEGYTVVPYGSISQADSNKGNQRWKKLAIILKKGSWDAIYARSDKEYRAVISKMIKEAGKAGYADCVKWYAKKLV